MTTWISSQRGTRVRIMNSSIQMKITTLSFTVRWWFLPRPLQSCLPFNADGLHLLKSYLLTIDAEDGLSGVEVEFSIEAGVSNDNASDHDTEMAPTAQESSVATAGDGGRARLQGLSNLSNLHGYVPIYS